MVYNKSLDEVKLISAMLCDLQTLHSAVFDQRSIRNTIQKIVKRVDREGIGFLTKTLPRLGKAFTKALSGEHMLDSASLAFESLPNSKLPKFLGELFQCVFSHDGMVLPTPCTNSIRSIRDICYLFYKYDIPYSLDAEQDVLLQFIQTEKDIAEHDNVFNQLANSLLADTLDNDSPNGLTTDCEATGRALKEFRPIVTRDIIRRARRLLNEVFLNFDPTDIIPRHGPGAVSTKEKLWGKYYWRNIPDRLASMYPIDSYFYASLGHICDSREEIFSLGSREDFAQVLLVPKDSRGPRLISCEPLVFQWIQQGLGRSIVQHVESHPQTRYEVHFTDQQPNRLAALFGSVDGRYSTLDLSEASDRVSVGLVRVLFPSKVLPYLLAARSLGTRMPDGRRLNLRKYAPMGSALCFPVLALTIWSLLRAMYPDAGPDEVGILVYGDDVIVPTAHAAKAIELLEAFGLKINRAKSCTSGFFRESCGMDAYKGIDVTPLRIRKGMSSSPSPESYTSWIAYANHFWDRKYFKTYDLVVGRLLDIYGQVPSKDLQLDVPSLYEVPKDRQHFGRRVNTALQKVEYYVFDTRSVVIRKNIPGWKMLLRYFTSEPSTSPLCFFRSSTAVDNRRVAGSTTLLESESFSVSSYTKRSANKLVRRWR